MANCLCEECECKKAGAVPVDLEEYEWLKTCADSHVNLRDAAGRICDMALDPEFKPSDEFRMWLKRLKAELVRDAA